MARNGSGTYSLPLPDVVANTVILAAWANTTLNDVETDMTDSLSRSGKGGMLAPLALIDGTLANPALAFSLELSSGLRRAGAADIRVVAAGADRIILAPAATTLNSATPAADVGTDFLLVSGNTRTAGSLFQLQNAANAVLNVAFDGKLTGTSRQVAAGTGTDFLLNTANTRTAGLLLNVSNNGSSKLSVDPAGAVVAASGVTAFGFTGASLVSGSGALALTGSGGGLNLLSNLAAGSASTDVDVNTTAARTAGVLFAARSNGVSRFAISNALGITATSGTAAAGAGVDFLCTTSVTRTAGSLFSVYNNGSTRFEVLSAGGTVATDRLAAGDTGTGFLLNTGVSRVAGHLLTIANNGTPELTVNYGGILVHGAGLVASAGAAPIRVNITADVANSSNTVASNVGPGITVKSGKTYHIHGRFRVWAAGATLGSGIGIKSTGGPTTSFVRIRYCGPVINGVWSHAPSATALSDTPPVMVETQFITDADAAFYHFDAIVVTTSAGTLQLLLISEVNLSTVTVGAGSWFEITED